MNVEYRYCPRCGAPLAERNSFGRIRRVCGYCGFVHFEDPKVAVAAVISQGDRVLLVRRAVIPQLGHWALPAGYMDRGELPEEALAREVAEETGLRVQIVGLEGIVPLAGWDEPRGILLVYRAQPAAGDLIAGDDVSEVRWFLPGELPWDEVAFASTADFLRAWLASRPAPEGVGKDPA